MPIFLITYVRREEFSGSSTNAVAFCSDLRVTLPLDARAFPSITEGQWYKFSGSTETKPVLDATNTVALPNAEIPFLAFTMPTEGKEGRSVVLRVHALLYERDIEDPLPVTHAYSLELGSTIAVPDNVKMMLKPDLIFLINVIRLRSEDRKQFDADWIVCESNVNLELGNAEIQSKKQLFVTEMESRRAQRPAVRCSSSATSSQTREGSSLSEPIVKEFPGFKVIMNVAQHKYQKPPRRPKARLLQKPFKPIESSLALHPPIPQWRRLEHHAAKEQLMAFGTGQLLAVVVEHTPPAALFFHSQLGYLHAETIADPKKKNRWPVEISTGDWASIKVNVVRRAATPHRTNCVEVRSVFEQVADPHPTFVFERDGARVVTVRLSLSVGEVDDNIDTLLSFDLRLQKLQHQIYHVVHDSMLGYIAMPQALFKEYSGQCVDCVVESLPLEATGDKVIGDFFVAFIVVEVFGPKSDEAPWVQKQHIVRNSYPDRKEFSELGVSSSDSEDADDDDGLIPDYRTAQSHSKVNFF